MKLKKNRKKPWIAEKVRLYDHEDVERLAINGVYMPIGFRGWKRRLIHGWDSCKILADSEKGNESIPKHCMRCPSSASMMKMGGRPYKKVCPDRLSTYSRAPSYSRWRPEETDDVRRAFNKPAILTSDKQLSLSLR